MSRTDRASIRVAYVGVLPPTRGGIAQHGARVVAALRDEGHDVEVVTWRSQYPGLLYKGSRVLDRGDGQRPWLRWWSPRSWKRARTFASSFDVAVLPWVTPFHAPIVRRISGAAPTTVAIVHNPLPHEGFPFARALTRWALRRVDVCIVHGEANEGLLRELLPDASIVSLAHPPNLDITWSPQPRLPPIRALFLGYVRRYKGVDVAIEAISRLVSDGVDITLTVAGESWTDSDHLQALRLDRGLGDRVELRLSYVPDEEIAPLLAGHHLLLAPYRSGTMSGVIPLALAAGRPVVATRVGAIPEIISDGVNGALAEPDDADSLADAIRRVIEDLRAISQATQEKTSSWRDFSEAIVSATRSAGPQQ